MDTGERIQRGEELLKKMLGPEQAAATRAAWQEVSPQFEKYVVELLAGEIWSRPQLDLRTRSLITMAAVMALGRPRALELSIRFALGNGVTPQEVEEALLHLAFYAGFPACWEALAVAKRVVAELSPPP